MAGIGEREAYTCRKMTDKCGIYIDRGTGFTNCFSKAFRRLGFEKILSLENENIWKGHPITGMKTTLANVHFIN